MTRLLLIGLDGAEPALLERWMAEGRLPHLARLRERGAFLRLRSTNPPVTFPAWTTCVTGVNPGRHGIFDFTEVTPGAYRLRFVNATRRQAPALWNILSAAGKRVAVLGVPGTWPPEPVNGVMVSGFDSPVATGVDASCVYPPELLPEVREWRFADVQESHIGPGWHERALEALLKKLEDKERIATRLLAREPWDFFMVVFGESDTVSHHFWLFHDPQSPRHRPGPQDALARVYSRLDAAVGRLVETAGEDVITMIVSDHGFGGAGTGVVHLNNWLALHDYLAFRTGGDSLLKRAALRYVPVKLRGVLFRRLRGLAEGAESKSRFGGIDWARTTAWSEELNYFPSVRVNLAGREPHGQVRAPDYRAFVHDVCQHLETWEVVERAWPRAELFEGPHVDRAPDIILELALENGYSHSCLRSRGGPPFRRLRPEEYFGGKERGMTGNHRPDGVCLLSTPSPLPRADIQDVAPTVLALLGVPAPPMDGRPLVAGASSPVPLSPVPAVGAAYDYTPAEAAVVEERLRGLGYLE
ncbi:MAG: alkaline phosphatase family protein [Candidatus Hydrogenedentes bacterium]|nr:alkaline phosphatase family protein [Candidatus Hydrogenedentota bacterium]